MKNKPKDAISISQTLWKLDPPVVEANGSKKVLELSYYDDHCLLDQDTNQLWIFVHTYIVRVAKAGRPMKKHTVDIQEINGTTWKGAKKNLDLFITTLEDQIPDGEDEKKWVPPLVNEVYSALKSGALKV